MLHISQLVPNEIYKVDNELIKFLECYRSPTEDSMVVFGWVVNNPRYGYVKSIVGENGITAFEELTSLEKELL